MTKRRLVWVVACLALAVGLGIWFVTRPHPVNETNFNRIRVGMTQAEVEAILGCPPGDYATRPWMADAFEEDYQEPDRLETWASDWGYIRVRFDKSDRVSAKELRDQFPIPQPGLLDRLRAWLGW